MKKQLMEFLGTFFFISTIAMTSNPIAIGLMLMAWLYIGGYISGGHFNPMVSLAVAIRGNLNWKDFPSYVIAQIAGGFLAYAMTYFIYGKISVPAPGSQVTLLQAFIVEILLAFVLALVVLVTATSDKFKNSQIFGFAIGLTIPALAAIGGPISGGLFNPAIALGSSLFALTKGLPIAWPALLMYVIGALIGGYLAAQAFKYFFQERPIL